MPTLPPNELSGQIVDAAFQIHIALGPGLLESIYEKAMAHELQKRQIPFKRQVHIPVLYDGVQLGRAFRADFIVDDQIILEIKSVEHLGPLHRMQLLSYLRLTNNQLGLLINFNAIRIKHGIERVVNKLNEPN